MKRRKCRKKISFVQDVGRGGESFCWRGVSCVIRKLEMFKKGGLNKNGVEKKN